MQVVAEADEPHGVAPAEPVEGEVGGHLDDQVGAYPGVGGAGCTPAVRGQPLGPGVGLLLEQRAEPRRGGGRSAVVRPAMRSRPLSSWRPRISSCGAWTGPVTPPTMASAVIRVRSFCQPRTPGR